jgi:NADPH:quinone reductase-like Zn-dependent oxidoreductase
MGFLAPYSFVSSCRSLIGFNLSLLPNRIAELRTAAAEVFRQWQIGRLRPIVGTRFEFERLPESHRALASRRTQGKLVVTVGRVSG